MAGRVYSTRFCRLFPPALTSSYVVPSGYVAVVRAVDLTSPSGGPMSFGVLVAGCYIVSLVNLAAATVYHWDGRQVAVAGESVTVNASGAGAWGLVSGYLFAA